MAAKLSSLGANFGRNMPLNVEAGAMVKVKSSLKSIQWAALYDDWHITYLQARTTQLQVWQALVAQAGDTGPGPTHSEIDQAADLQRGADRKLANMNEFLREALD